MVKNPLTRGFGAQGGVTKMKKINGKQVKITRAGYLYIDGIKISERRITPISGPKIECPAIAKYVHEWAARNYIMVNS